MVLFQLNQPLCGIRQFRVCSDGVYVTQITMTDRRRPLSSILPTLLGKCAKFRSRRWRRGWSARAGPAIHPACSFLGRLLAMEGVIEEWAGLEGPGGS